MYINLDEIPLFHSKQHIWAEQLTMEQIALVSKIKLFAMPLSNLYQRGLGARSSIKT